MAQKNLSINRNVPAKGVLAIAITSILLMSGCNETKPSLSQGEIMENAAEAAISKKKKALSDEWQGTGNAVIGGTAAQDAIGGAAQDAIGGVAQDAIGGVAQDAIGGVAQDAIGGAAQDAIGGAAQNAIGGVAQDAIGGAAQNAIGGAVGGILNTDGYSR
jgi:hypothetical protein